MYALVFSNLVPANLSIGPIHPSQFTFFRRTVNIYLASHDSSNRQYFRPLFLDPLLADLAPNNSGPSINCLRWKTKPSTPQNVLAMPLSQPSHISQSCVAKGRGRL